MRIKLFHEMVTMGFSRMTDPFISQTTLESKKFCKPLSIANLWLIDWYIG